MRSETRTAGCTWHRDGRGFRNLLLFRSASLVLYVAIAFPMASLTHTHVLNANNKQKKAKDSRYSSSSSSTHNEMNQFDWISICLSRNTEMKTRRTSCFLKKNNVELKPISTKRLNTTLVHQLLGAEISPSHRGASVWAEEPGAGKNYQKNLMTVCWSSGAIYRPRGQLQWPTKTHK